MRSVADSQSDPATGCQSSQRTASSSADGMRIAAAPSTNPVVSASGRACSRPNPTHDHGRLLFSAARCALDQTVADLELFIVGDGVPDVTREVVAELDDERVRFFDNPKAPSRGEVLRRAALAEAGGEIVCYLADDDLWMPHHVASHFAAGSGISSKPTAGSVTTTTAATSRNARIRHGARRTPSGP